MASDPRLSIRQLQVRAVNVPMSRPLQTSSGTIAIAPFALIRKLQGQFRLLGSKGVAGMALAGIDMAAWDALSKAQGLPLARMLGGDLRRIPAYNSCGLGMIDPGRAAAEAQELVAPGFRAIKVRLGYPDLATDVAVVRAVKRAIGDDVLLMSDYNQGLSVAEAIRRIQALDDEGLYWIEEPTLADDYAGYARRWGKTGGGRTRWRDARRRMPATWACRTR